MITYNRLGSIQERCYGIETPKAFAHGLSMHCNASNGELKQAQMQMLLFWLRHGSHSLLYAQAGSK